MANMLYNGVELPDINTVWTDKETYPYAVVLTHVLLSGAFSELVFSKTPVTFDGETNARLKSISGGEVYRYDPYNVVGSGAREVWSWCASSSGAYDLSSVKKIWSNHDILNTVDGSVYLAASEPLQGEVVFDDTITTFDGGQGQNLAILDNSLLFSIGDVLTVEFNGARYTREVADIGGTAAFGDVSENGDFDFTETSVLIGAIEGVGTVAFTETAGTYDLKITRYRSADDGGGGDSGDDEGGSDGDDSGFNPDPDPSIQGTTRKAYVSPDGVARKMKKGYIGIYQDESGIPGGFKQLLYIESNAAEYAYTHYIDTGVIPGGDDFSVEMDIQTTASAGASNWFLNINNAYPTTSAGFLQFGTYSSKFGVHFKSVVVDGATTASSARVLISFAVKGKKLTLSGDAEYSYESPYIESGAYRNSSITICDGKWRCFGCKVYVRNTLVRDYVPAYRDSDGAVGLYDFVEGQFYPNNGTGAYIAGDVVAAESRPAGSYARRLVKVYLGIGNVARPTWTAEERQLVYYGTITAPQSVRTNLAGARAGDYALFAGGEYSSAYNHVDAYDASYTRRIPTGLSSARTRLAGASVGGSALFAGGLNKTTVERYDADLTRTTVAALSGGGEFPAGVSDFNGFALFMGGVNGGKIAEAYDGTMTRHTAAAASVVHNTHRGEKVGGYALFAGGYSPSPTRSAVVEVYDGELSRTNAADMSATRSNFSSAQVGKYALFAGGRTGSGSDFTASVDAYDSELTKTKAPDLHMGKMNAGGGSLEGHALFVGGYGASKWTAVAEDYSENLSKTAITSMSGPNEFIPSVTLGDSAIFYVGGVTEVYKLM